MRIEPGFKPGLICIYEDYALMISGQNSNADRADKADKNGLGLFDKKSA